MIITAWDVVVVGIAKTLVGNLILNKLVLTFVEVAIVSDDFCIVIGATTKKARCQY